MDLVKHPTWDIMDSSKVDELANCPRKFFYRYILGWESDVANNDLVFGESWHKAMEYLMLNGATTKNVEPAFRCFMGEYRKVFSQETDEIFHPKNPRGAMEALYSYVANYQDEKLNVKYTEISGTAPINVNRTITFRLDSIVHNPADGKYYSYEHKTTGLSANIWAGQWELSFQIGTYSHVLYCLYPPEQVGNVIVNGAIFKKTKALQFEFIRVPIYKTHGQIYNWLFNINRYFDLYEQELAWLEEDCSKSEKGEPMSAFPMNPKSCYDYFRECPFHPFCVAWNNPLEHIYQVPLGFRVNYWNPVEKESKVIMNLADTGDKENAN